VITDLFIATRKIKTTLIAITLNSSEVLKVSAI
jgi:hypothetical protein